jgi:thymidylate synthase
MIIKGGDVDEVLYETAVLLSNAPTYSPRGQKTKELIKPQLIIENPEYSVISNPGRKLSQKYLKAEMDWYLSGEKSVDRIREHSSMWDKIKDVNGEVNSNYGEIVFHQQMPNYNGSQFDWVVESLKQDKDSRQALINFNQPKHKDTETKDFVCTLGAQYMIRDNKLEAFTDMRSNDLIYGFSFDFPFFSYVQQKVLEELKETYPDLEMGSNTHTATSLHVYERHFPMIDKIIAEYDTDVKSRRLEDLV